ncbi:lysozyme inhibitor LprI family protein [Fluviicola sp.]|uniref:lysozyme inhibitor LprI family protein n=1 Tax=Fluviicola sp. TaxID=1917219 RepID=UPI0026154AD8|nr:lysozyme inhibitor LprI family protein [Fluviicola sp.]
MKLSPLVILLFFFSVRLNAQVSDSEMESLKADWWLELKKEAHQMIRKMPREEGMSDFADSVQRLFVQDTFVVENILRRQSDKEPTTLGMNKANLFCASEYEKLVDKYFSMLQAKMKKEDVELLLSWQKDWRKLMATEQALIGKLMQEHYSGGGSIHSIEYTARLMNQNKNRLLTIIDYLTHMI